MGPAKAQPTQEEIDYLTENGYQTRFDNDGNMVVSNRAARRKKTPSDPAFTKATHSLNLARAKSKKAYRKNH